MCPPDTSEAYSLASNTHHAQVVRLDVVDAERRRRSSAGEKLKIAAESFAGSRLLCKRRSPSTHNLND